MIWYDLISHIIDQIIKHPIKYCFMIWPKGWWLGDLVHDVVNYKGNDVVDMPMQWYSEQYGAWYGERYDKRYGGFIWLILEGQ